MLEFLKAEAKRFMKYMRDERGFLQALIPLAASAAAGYFGSKNSGSSSQSSNQNNPQLINTLSPGQQAVDSALQRYLTQGADPYTGRRIAGPTGNENYLQDSSRNLLQTSIPALSRILSGEFPEEYFNQAVADPTRRQFNERVAPVMRENSALTGNRFADRSAIEMGQARGDVESSILQQRGQWGQEALYAPAKYGPSVASTLQGYEGIFSSPRLVEQAQLDTDYQEFLRTNPNSGGLLTGMMQYINSPINAAYNRVQTDSVGNQAPSILTNLLLAGGVGRSAGLFG